MKTALLVMLFAELASQFVKRMKTPTIDDILYRNGGPYHLTACVFRLIAIIASCVAVVLAILRYVP